MEKYFVKALQKLELNEKNHMKIVFAHVEEKVWAKNVIVEKIDT